MMKKTNLLTSIVMGLSLLTVVPTASAVIKRKTAVEPQTAQTTPTEAKPGTPETEKSVTNTRVSPEAGLQRLIEGNKRFMHDKTICPERNQERRLETVAKQKPFAVILGCSDSRIPPEFAFDQGIGDIFVIRIAGNVVSKLEMDSVEYSVLHNDSSIVMVLGHQNCGAVTAVMQDDTKDIESIAELIKPALYKANHEKLNLEEATITNVKNSVARIKRSRVIANMIKEGKIKVVGAYYNLGSGEAKIVSDD